MKPTLLILAAGVGSRYGSLKQMDGFGPSRETIIEYSIYDAIRAGFGKVVFVVRESIQDEFKAVFEPKLSGKIETAYVLQELTNVPDGITVPKERQKPWGTGHAVMVAAEAIQEPFAVINADDFYGSHAYQVIHDFLIEEETASLSDKERYCMVGYRLSNTLSDHGYVSRGICETDNDNFLTSITERTKISREKKGIVFREGEDTVHPLKGDETVSMNLMGFTPSFFQHSQAAFAEFIQKNLTNLKAEFYLPFIINTLLYENKASMKVLHTDAKWFGVTYKEDKEVATQKIAAMVEQGIYPENLWK